MLKIGLTLLLCGLAVVTTATDAEDDRPDIEIYQSLLRSRHLAVEFTEYFRNITVQDVLAPGVKMAKEQDLQCVAELAMLSQGVQKGSLWALQMIDSWGRLPAGLLYGNMKDLGNFDECIRVDQPMTNGLNNLRGKYCLANLFSIGQSSKLNRPLSGFGIKTGVCFPASCTSQNMDAPLRQLIKQLSNISLKPEGHLIDPGTCQTGDTEALDGLTIFTLVFVGICMAATLVATLCDYFLCNDQKQLPALVRIFSARVNSRTVFRLVERNSNPNIIDCLHGIRCLSFIWVVYGHEYVIQATTPIINMVDIIPWYRSSYSMFILHGLFSVDTFFFLSGLLLVMIGMRSMERNKGKLNVALMYLHRLLRLTPVIVVAILFYMKILPLMNSGPLKDTVNDSIIEPCEENWYLTLLYVQNYVTIEMCLPHSWYLSADMHMYIIAPFLLIALYKWGRKAVAGILVLMLLLVACLFSTIVIKEYSIASGSGKIGKIYFTTHTRASPWIIGFLFGYYLHVNRGKTFKLNRLTVWLGWLISLGLLFTCIFALLPYQSTGIHLPIVNEAFYVTLTRVAWPIALAWVVFACKYGYGGMADSFLSAPVWQPLSKLSYSAYIWHIFIQSINSSIIRTNTYFSNYQVMLRFWHDFGFTVLFAYAMYIIIEAPFSGLEMLLLPNRRPRPVTQPPEVPKSQLESSNAVAIS